MQKIYSVFYALLLFLSSTIEVQSKPTSELAPNTKVVHRCKEAPWQKCSEITLWGDGVPRRHRMFCERVRIMVFSPITHVAYCKPWNVAEEEMLILDPLLNFIYNWKE